MTKLPSSLPKLKQNQFAKQQVLIPRKFKKIPKKATREPLQFVFSNINMNNYRFKNKKDRQLYFSPFKGSNSTHIQRPNQDMSKTLLSFSSKTNDIENQSIQFQNLKQEEAKQYFYKAYKNKIPTVHHSAQNSLIHSILHDLDEYQLLPKGIESLRQSRCKPLQLKQSALNKGQRLKFIANIIQNQGKCPGINLSENKLNHHESQFIIEKLLQFQIVNLSGNSIGSEGIHSLIEILNNPLCRIRILDISRNNLSDSIISSLINNITSYPLSSLNVSKNLINRKTSIQLKLLMKQNRLQQLYVGWNNIDSLSASYIFEGLTTNTSLRFLDISWNKIGNSQKLKQTICKMIVKNTTLIHIDLSYCSFNIEECQSMSKSLLENHSIIGLHLAGSPAYMDSRGYLNITSLNRTFYNRQQVKKIKYSKNKNSESPICWICQNWRQFKLEQDVSKQQILQNQERYVHFSFQNYFPVPLDKIGNKYRLVMFVPEQKFQFFFSQKSKEGSIITFASHSYDKVSADLKLENVFVKFVNQHKQMQITNYKNDKNNYIQSRILQKIKGIDLKFESSKY